MNLRQMFWPTVCISPILVISFLLWWTWASSAPVNLRFATGPEGGTFYTMGAEIAKIVHDVHSDITLKVTTDESAGSVENMKRLSTDDPNDRVDIAIVQNDTEPIGDVQTLIPLHRSVCHFLVPQHSDIHDVYELRGKRVAVGKRNSGNLHIVHALLDHFGVTLSDIDEESDFTPVYDGIRACGEKLKNGEIDAALVMTAVTSPTLTALIKQGNVRYVSLGSPGDSNEIDGFAVTYPYVEKYTIPRYVYPVRDSRHGKPEQPCTSFALRSSLVCRGDLPDAVARSIVETIVTKRATLMREHHEAHDITEHFDPSDVQFPMHHGAMAYYQRQRPSFIERYAEPMAFVLSLFLAICGLVAAINKWLTLRKKNRIDRYYERLDILLDELNAQQISNDRLDSIEQELMTMRHDAVRGLVSERLLADESFQIFQSLLTNCHQQLSLQRRPNSA